MLGNQHPKIVTEIETIIWEEIFDLANGMQTVHDAAFNVVNHIPTVYDHFQEDDRRWFKLGKLLHRHFLSSSNK